MEIFAEIIKDFQSINVFAQISILDGWQAFDEYVFVPGLHWCF